MLNRKIITITFFAFFLVLGIFVLPAISDAQTTSSDDHSPPWVISGQPTGVLETGITQTTLSLETDELATCRYSSDKWVPYDLMTGIFGTTSLLGTGAFSHSALVTGLNSNTAYNYYIKCSDLRGNVTPDDFLISFSTAPEVPAQPKEAPSAAPSPTLSVTLTATPSSGEAPLYGVDLTADVSGTATGTVHYTFYCNRSDAGTNVTSGYDAQYYSIASASKKVDDICSYSSPGTYYSKVIVERGSKLAEARAEITALTAKTTLEGIQVKIIDIQQKLIELMKKFAQFIQASLLSVLKLIL